jgi:hypothetical protein
MKDCGIADNIALLGFLVSKTRMIKVPERFMKLLDGAKSLRYDYEKMKKHLIAKDVGELGKEGQSGINGERKGLKTVNNVQESLW